MVEIQVVRMSEKQLKEFRDSIKRVRDQNATSRAKARKFLQEEGVLTATGKLTRKYTSKKS
jgi:hypothetical protein